MGLNGNILIKMEKSKNGLILGLDVSTKTIGIALFEDNGENGKLKLLHHVTPKVKPQPESKMEELFLKANALLKNLYRIYLFFLNIAVLLLPLKIFDLLDLLHLAP